MYCKRFEPINYWPEKVDYPFHLGITEAGTLLSGTVKSALGIGLLLYQGIGDTLRVSLTAHPREEIKVAYDILRALGLRKRGSGDYFLSHLRTVPNRSVALGPKSRKSGQKIYRALKGGYHGLCGQRSRRGPGRPISALPVGKGLGLLFAKGRMIRKVPEGIWPKAF